jgi:hypothetical protein
MESVLLEIVIERKLQVGTALYGKEKVSWETYFALIG